MDNSKLVKLNLPSDIPKLTHEELEQLATEVRATIIDVVSKNGGHLAPSLGVVELTLALLKVLDVEKDNIVWDVGHQSYAYKILTDRLHSFHTLRQFKGISGFSRPKESRYDKTISGHTSTSISSALGISYGDDFLKKNSKTIAVIGDGALSGGMAFEALNNYSSFNKNLVIILNDNEMSIDKNVGAFASFLSNSLSGEFATKFKKDIQNIVEDAPLGDVFISFVKKVEASVIGFFTPGSFFESLGVRYIGPVNGHKIKDIEKALNNAFLQKTPVLIHVITKKGKGYAFAEKQPNVFHGVAPFCIEDGALISKKCEKSWTDAFSDILLDAAFSNDRIVAITAAMKDGTGLKKFSEIYNSRFFDVGIAEQHAVTFASGLATSGMLPVVAIYSTFLQRAFDQIIHDIAIPSLHVIFCIDRAGLVGADGSTHHGVFDISYMRMIPNMIIMLPKDIFEFKSMFKLAVKLNKPIAIRYPRGRAEYFNALPETPVEIGVPEVIYSGKDVAIISCGHIFNESIKVYDMLKDKLSITLINLRFVKPLDKEIFISNLIGKKLIVTIEDGVIKGGVGEEVQSILNEFDVFIPILKIGMPDEFIEHGTVNELQMMLSIDHESIAKKIVKKYEKIKN